MLLWENVDGTCRKPQFSWCVPSKADFGGSRLGDTSCASQGECCLALLSYGECYTITLSDKYHNNDNTEKMPRKWYTSILYTRYILRSIYIYYTYVSYKLPPRAKTTTSTHLRFTFDVRLRFTIYGSQSTIYNLWFTTYDLQSTLHNLRFTMYSLRSTWIIYIYSVVQSHNLVRKAIVVRAHVRPKDHELSDVCFHRIFGCHYYVAPKDY